MYEACHIEAERKAKEEIEREKREVCYKLNSTTNYPVVWIG